MTLCATACTSGGATQPKLTEAWTLSSVTPIGQPVAAGETVVVYATVKQDLYLYGVSGDRRDSQMEAGGVAQSGDQWRPHDAEGARRPRRLPTA